MADDHRLFCDGLERLLNEHGAFRVIEKYHDGKKVLDGVARLKPDLLIVDIEMPGLNGLEVISRTRLLNSHVKIVVLSMHEESIYSRESSALGANAYMVKSVESNILIASLLRICQNETAPTDATTARQPADSILSAREHQILQMLSKGKTSVEIAEDLSIAFHTVKTHRRNIMRKLNAKNTAELLTKAIATGIL